MTKRGAPCLRKHTSNFSSECSPNPLGLVALLYINSRHWHEIRDRLMKLNRNPQKDEKSVWKGGIGKEEKVVFNKWLSTWKKCVYLCISLYTLMSAFLLTFLLPSLSPATLLFNFFFFCGFSLAFACPDRLLNHFDLHTKDIYRNGPCFWSFLSEEWDPCPWASAALNFWD